ncbi:MAG: hypothetical protein U9Q37_10070 [Euryarchaeota archaeon]|nr:hypothetical protein [Euryarchaeota archaeon]
MSYLLQDHDVVLPVIMVNVTASHTEAAVSDAVEDARRNDNTATTHADFSEIGGTKSGSREPAPAL